MMFTDPRTCLVSIARDLALKRTAASDQELLAAIRRQTKAAARFVVFVLDEIDQLAVADARVFEDMLRWPEETGNCALVCIANSLDLTIRHGKGAVENLYFVPYNVQDIAAILSDRLGRVNALVGRVIEPMAIELCARKIAAVGDLRKALDVMRQAIDFAEAGKTSGACLVTVEHVLRAVERSFGLASKTEGVVREMNVHQKMVLVVLLLLFRAERGVARPAKPTVRRVYDKYSALLTGRRMMEPLERGDFVDLVVNLESAGAVGTSVGVGAGGQRRVSKGVLEWGHAVSLTLPIQELQVALLKEDTVTRSFLGEEGGEV